MSGAREHDLHRRRRSRNVGVAVVLGAFILLVFGLTIAKVSQGDRMEAFDHTYRSSQAPVQANEGGN